MTISMLFVSLLIPSSELMYACAVKYKIMHVVLAPLTQTSMWYDMVLHAMSYFNTDQYVVRHGVACNEVCGDHAVCAKRE